VHQAEDAAGQARRSLDIPEGTCFASDKGPVRIRPASTPPSRCAPN